MSLADLGNNELIIVRKQWHVHHQSTLSGQFLLPAAALSYCSQQWRIMTTEHNNRGLFSSVSRFVSHCFRVTITRRRSRLISLARISFWLLISLPGKHTHSHTHGPGHKCLFIHFTGPAQRPRLRSFPVHSQRVNKKF